MPISSPHSSMCPPISTRASVLHPIHSAGHPHVSSPRITSKPSRSIRIRFTRQFTDSSMVPALCAPDALYMSLCCLSLCRLAVLVNRQMNASAHPTASFEIPISIPSFHAPCSTQAALRIRFTLPIHKILYDSSTLRSRQLCVSHS